MKDGHVIEFKDWLQSAIHEKRLTGAELAEKSGISKASVYFYLNGSRVPNWDNIHRIIAALEIAKESLPQFERKPVGRPRAA